jgi:hypothetical protein
VLFKVHSRIFRILQIFTIDLRTGFIVLISAHSKVGAPVKDIYAVLLQKERDVERVRHEIESLRYVATILTDEMMAPEPERAQAAAAGARNKWPLDMRDIQRGETGS